MARKTFLCLALLIGIVLSASPVLSLEKTLFGPKTFTVGRFHFCSSLNSFRVEKPGGALLEISNANSHGKIYSGYINLNGRFFSLHPILHAKNSTMQVPVDMRGRNYLWVFLYGQRGGAIKLKVKEAKQEPANHEPIADAQTLELDEDTTASITLAGTDQDGDPLTFRIVTAPAHGTLSGEAPALNYTPSADYNGSDAFTFVVNDGQSDSQIATVNITVRPVNDPPTAVAITPAIAQVGMQVPLDGNNSTDVDDDTLTCLWTLASYPSGLEPALSNATAPLAFFVPQLPGQYKVCLVVNDGKTDSAPATVTVSVAYPPFSLTEEKLTAGDGGTGNRFGSSVSVDSHRAIVGADGKEAAYIFESNSPWAEKTRLAAGKAGDGFGSAVAVSGDYALVGALGDDDLGVDSGSAYLFKRENGSWTQAAKLKADDGKAGDFFGAAVSLSGDYAVVGAYGDDTNEETWVPIFGQDLYVPGNVDTTWEPTLSAWKNPKGGAVVLKPSADKGWADNFRPRAIRVTHTSNPYITFLQVLDKSRKILGFYRNYVSAAPVVLTGLAEMGEIQAYYPQVITNIEFLVPATGGGVDAGSAYVFTHDGTSWTQQAHLKASDGAEGDAFGTSVAVSGQTIIVGADRDDDNGQDSGSAYVFSQNGAAWVEEAKLLAKEGSKGDRFGASVALSGNVAVVGAPHPDATDAVPGTAYVFRYNGLNWIEEAKLTAIDGEAGDLFGASVSVSGDYVVVGAPAADGSGALYVFKFDGATWDLEGKVVPKDAAGEQMFGGSVSMSGDVILSGATGDSSQAGAAYAYSIDTYHTAGIWAEPQVIKEKGASTISWSWVNAYAVQIEPGIGTFVVEDDPIGSGLLTVSPDTTTTYTIEAFGPYGKDKASVTVAVEP
jgi:hypothetical protein